MDRISLMMKRHLNLLLLLALLLAACGPSEAEIQATVAAAEIRAVSTAYAQLTEFALANPSATPTLPPTATATPTLLATLFATPTTGLGGGQPSGCDAMTFVADVTIPDGEEVAAGTSFTKTWSVRNSGTCDWTTAYQLIYMGGERMGGPNGVALTAAVPVGQTTNISVSLVAPATAGEYTGYWSIANAAGTAFGHLFLVIEVP